MRIKTIYRKLLSDLTSPVSMFLKLRERYAEVLLLESSDYGNKENSLSFICFDSIGTLEIKKHVVIQNDFTTNTSTQKELKNVVGEVSSFIDKYKMEAPAEIESFLGLFGYTGFDAIKYFETIELDDQKPNYKVPDIRYDMFRNIIVFDHFYGNMYVIENIPN